MHHTVLVWLSFVGIVLTDAEISIQSTTLAPIFGPPLQYTGSPYAYHPFRSQPSPFLPASGLSSDYQTALARNSISVPVLFNPGSYQQDNYFRPIPVPVSYDPNSQLLPNPFQTRNNLYVNSFLNRSGFSGYSTPVPVLVKTPFDYALQSTPRPFGAAYTPEPYYSSTPFYSTTQAPLIYNSPESLPVIINNGYRKHPKTLLNRLNRPQITTYSTTPVPETTRFTTVPAAINNNYRIPAKTNFNNLIRPDVTSFSTIPFPITTQATPTVNTPASLPVVIDNGFKKHPKSKLNHLIRPDIAKYLTTTAAGAAVTTQATPTASAESLPVIINYGYKKHPKNKVNHLIRPDLKIYSTVSPQSNTEPTVLPRYYPNSGAAQFTPNYLNQSQSPKAVQLNSNSLNLAQRPVQYTIPPQLTSTSLNQEQPFSPVQFTTNSQSTTQSPVSAQLTSNTQNQAQSLIPNQFTSNYQNQGQLPNSVLPVSNILNQAQPTIAEQLTSNSLEQSQPGRPTPFTSYSQNEAQTPLKVQFLSSNSLAQTQQFTSNFQNQAQSQIPEQSDSNNLNQAQSFRPLQSLNTEQSTSNPLNQVQYNRPVQPSYNLQNQESPLRTFSLVPPSNGRQVLISNPSLLQKMYQIFKKGDQTGSLLTSSAVFPKPGLDDTDLDDSYAKTIAYITSLLRANSEKEPLVYIGTTPAPDISRYLEISTPATAVSRVNFKAGDTNYNY